MTKLTFMNIHFQESFGNIVLFGKEEEHDPVALHIYGYKTGWKKLGTQPAPCSHWNQLFILLVMIDNTEYLSVSCPQCRTIWVCDMQNGKFNEVFKEEGFYPGLMCKAEENHVYILNDMKGLKQINKVKCMPTEFTEDKIRPIQSQMRNIDFMQYLPDIKCISLSSWEEHVVKAIHCETSEVVWEVKGKVEGVTWNPHVLWYSSEHDFLVVSDTSYYGRLVVLNPYDGSLLQTVPLSISRFQNFSFLHERNIVLCNRNDTGKNNVLFC